MGDHWQFPHYDYSAGGNFFYDYDYFGDRYQQMNQESRGYGQYGHVGSSSQFNESYGMNSQYIPMDSFQNVSINESNRSYQTKVEDFHNHGGGDSLEQPLSLEELCEPVSKELDIMSKLPSTKYKSSGSSKFWRKSSKKDKCDICKSKYRENETMTTLPCGHIFHQYCLYTWFTNNTNCSTCKKEVDV